MRPGYQFYFVFSGQPIILHLLSKGLLRMLIFQQEELQVLFSHIPLLLFRPSGRKMRCLKEVSIVQRSKCQVCCSPAFVKETYGRDAEFTEGGRDERIGATEYAEGNRTWKRGGDAEHITQG